LFYFEFMKNMLVYPCAKVNIGLKLIKKRSDGYHDLESVFMKIPVYDILEIVPNEIDEMRLELSGIDIPGKPEDNLLLECYRQVKPLLSDLKGIDCHLHKQIPIGAGLGGGSSDAAYFLKALNEMFGTKLSDHQLKAILDNLGSDCSFFLKDKPQFVSGIGSEQSDVELNVKDLWMVLVYPNIHISTKEAYGNCYISGESLDLKRLVERSLWSKHFTNDFEKQIFESYPVIKELKEELIAAGALYATMTGSGSTVYGIFNKEPQVQFNSDYWVRSLHLTESYLGAFK